MVKTYLNWDEFDWLYENTLLRPMSTVRAGVAWCVKMICLRLPSTVRTSWTMQYANYTHSAQERCARHLHL